MTSVDELAARRDVYRLVARLLLAEIDAPLAERLLELGMIDGEQRIDDLAAEFCRLFVGPGPACLPYASAYGTPALLRGAPERRFARFLAEHGLQTVAGGAPALLGQDHIGIELTVLAHLYDRRCGSPPAAAELARRHAGILVTEHLLPWGLTFAAAFEAAARLEPYRWAARTLAGLLRDERAMGPAVAAG